MATMSTLNGYEVCDNAARNAALNGVKTSGTGSAYVATVPGGIKWISQGFNFVMVPHVASTSTAPTLNVNGTGALTIRRRLSNSTSSTTTGQSSSWLAANKPVRITYDGTFWVVTDYVKPVASDLYGTLSIEQGGTGATDTTVARTNLDVYSKTEIDNKLGDIGTVLASVTGVSA